jgi:transcription initiation factor IIE alpha subunit
MTGAPFPRFDDLRDRDDARRIAERTGLPVAEVRAALRRLRDERHRGVVRARTRAQT